MEGILKKNFKFKPSKDSKYTIAYRFENKDFHYRVHTENKWLRKLLVINNKPIPKHFKFVEDFYFKDKEDLIEYLEDEYLGENLL